jgi:hypothetical protein
MGINLTGSLRAFQYEPQVAESMFVRSRLDDKS